MIKYWRYTFYFESSAARRWTVWFYVLLKFWRTKLPGLESESGDHVRAKRSSNYSSNRPRLELLLALEALPSELSERYAADLNCFSLRQFKFVFVNARNNFNKRFWLNIVKSFFIRTKNFYSEHWIPYKY